MFPKLSLSSLKSNDALMSYPIYQGNIVESWRLARLVANRRSRSYSCSSTLYLKRVYLVYRHFTKSYMVNYRIKNKTQYILNGHFRCDYDFHKLSVVLICKKAQLSTVACTKPFQISLTQLRTTSKLLTIRAQARRQNDDCSFAMRMGSTGGELILCTEHTEYQTKKEKERGAK